MDYLAMDSSLLSCNAVLLSGFGPNVQESGQVETWNHFNFIADYLQKITEYQSWNRSRASKGSEGNGKERKHRGIQEYKQTKGLNTQTGIGQSEDTRRETAELNTLNHIMETKTEHNSKDKRLLQ